MGALIRLAALLFVVLMRVSCCEGCWKQERDRLLGFKVRFSTPPDPTVDLTIPVPFANWVDDTDCCQWEQVQCNSTTRRVVNLTLDSWLYDGSNNWHLNLSDFLVFEDLQTLDLSHNGIDGCVGNGGLERRKLSKLEVLDLSYNELGGTSFNIVSCFSALSSLKSLNLSYNNLTAESFQSLEKLPSSLRNLEVLDLCGNYYLTNDILLSLGNLSSLKTLHLCRNALDSELNISGLTSKWINLEVLDMSGNDFSQAEYIFSSLSGLSSLKSLILNYCKLTSISGLSKLHSLEVLDLSANYLNISFHTLSPRGNGRLPWPTNLEVLALGGNIGLGNDIFPSLNGLQRLKSLDLGCNNLDGFNITGTTFQRSLKVLTFCGMNIDANMLRKLSKAFSSITMLDLGGSEFKGAVTAGDFGELSNLENLVLDFCSNLQNEFFNSIGALTSLKVLSMSYCEINGTLPPADWSNLKKLEELDISYNHFKGPLPSSFSNMTSLRKLDLSHNGFTENPAPNLAGLPSLEYLGFTENQFQVPASLSFFANHSYLKFIDGQGNNVIPDPYPISQTWVPKFQLQELILPATTQTSYIPFPSFLFYQNNLNRVDLSGCKFGGEFPNWLLVNNTKLIYLNLRNNSFTGHFLFPSHPTPNIQSFDVSDNAISGKILGNNITSLFPNLYSLNMSSNNLSGEILANISARSPFIQTLILSNNKFSGHVSPLLALHHLRYLRLDGNYFSGTIPSSFSNSSVLEHADLSNNLFVGKLPRSIWKSSNLIDFSMSNNHLEGSIPKEFGGLYSLDLSGNNLSGPVPSFMNSSRSVINLSNNRLSSLATGMFSVGQEVAILDLSNNEITGTIQDAISNISYIYILLLKGNQFRGHIPRKLCSLRSITILDFSRNSLSGSVPNCLGEISFNSDPNQVLGKVLGVPSIGVRQANFTTKNNAYKYEGDILGYMTGMDLSHNKLDGNIPPELGNMTGIKAINLSHNDITGHIPSTFSNLKQIESFDLSFNKLSGRIPPELTQLTSLEVFSVAHNNLSGATPDRKGQFITFDEGSYEGNPFLCGPPLQTSCGDQPPQPSSSVEGDVDSGFMDMEVFYISMAVSWTMVLLVMAAVLCINPYWRQAWFHFVEHVINTCYYFVIDHFPKMY